MAMLRLVLTLGLPLLFCAGTLAQLDKFYSIKESYDFDTVNFYLKATSANCLMVKPDEGNDPLSIYGKPNLNKINPNFETKVRDKTCFATLALDEYNSSGFSNSFTLAVSRSDKENDLWKVNFSDKKVYDLNLFYGFGNAEINLTGTSVKRLKINSGSADIIVGYDEHSINPVRMDTFFIMADIGSIIARNMELARARHVITKIGFGNMLLDFDRTIEEECQINASVGAGNLEILLPQKDTPVIIHIKNSPLCAMTLPDGFEEVEKNVFVNMSYAANAENLLSFYVDVALGRVQFDYTD